jgi:hypothetical protein
MWAARSIAQVLRVWRAAGLQVAIYSAGIGATEECICNFMWLIFFNREGNMKNFKSLRNKLLPALIFLPCLSSPADATILFSDDFQTGYTWPAIPMTSQSTAQSQLGNNWQNVDWATNHGAIDAWPADISKRAYRIQYAGSDDLDVITHKFDPTHTHGTSRPTEIYVQWKEYRSSGFDCGPSKDWRAPAFRANEFGGGVTYPFVDIYGSFGNVNPAGVNACNAASINIQGYGARQLTGDPNMITSTNYVLPRATVKTIQLHLKMNTPNQSDGAAEMWVDGAKLLGRTDVKFSPDGWPQIYLDGFQLGMSATNGGLQFAAPSYIWRTDVVIADTFIGGATTPPATVAPPSAPTNFTVTATH